MKNSKKEALHFSKISIRNWKNFLNVDSDLQRRVFLVGPNASGKSNFLDVFRFLRDLASPGAGFKESVRRRGGVSAMRCLSARAHPNIEIQVVVEGPVGSPHWEYALAFSQDKQRRPIIKKEKVVLHGRILLERPDADDQNDPERLTQTYLEQVNVNRSFRELVGFFESVRYLHIVPQLVREPDRSVGKQHDPYGGDFLEQLAKTPEKTRNARLRRISEALSIAVPQLKEIELKRDNRGTPHLRGKYSHWRSQGAWQTEEQFSDGTLRLVGLLWAVMEGSGPLLLEEPELSLHPEVVNYLPPMFARIQMRTGRQIILSTHSPELLRDDGIGCDEVLLLRPIAEGTSVTPADKIEDTAHLLEGGLTIAEVVIPKTRPEKADQLSLFGD